MRNIGKHVSKSTAHKYSYIDNLKNMDYEPTIDDTLKFPETDDKERDFSLPKSSKKRPIPLKNKFHDHIEQNWLSYLIGIIGIIFFYFMVDSKTDISRIDTNVSNIKDDVNELKNDHKENINTLHKQKLEILENKYRIKAIEATTQAIKKK